jgi:hypothetical protein
VAEQRREGGGRLEENAVAWYMLMDNRISGLDLQSVPGFPFSRPYRDKLDIATRKEPSGEPYNYFTSSIVLRSASRKPNIEFARSLRTNERTTLMNLSILAKLGRKRRNDMENVLSFTSSDRTER